MRLQMEWANDLKPPYSVPSMAQIAALPPNGFNVVSTFSGCGGSCLGFKMAGFKVLWGSEFIPAAQETYRANHPGTILDCRDIRQIQPEDIRAAIGNVQVDVLEGSPPCSSFSTAGKREQHWGEVKAYSDTQQRTDDLFFEFARILKGLQPKVFVAENVSGLVKGKAKGYFLEILGALKAAGYVVSAKLLDAQWLGVPQARQRVIFVGVRNDIGLAPVHPSPLPYHYTVKDALPWIVQVKHSGKPANWQPSSRPVPTIVADGATISPTGYMSGGTYVEAESDISRYAIGAEWQKLGPGERSAKYAQLIRSDENQPCNTVTGYGARRGLATVTHPTECRKFSIQELKALCGFPADFILTGTYEQQWERLGRAVPPVMMRAVAEKVRDDILRRIK